MHTSMILVDLQKAFYTSDRGVLFEKINYFDFQTFGIKWFESHLSNRNFWFVLVMFFLRQKH